MEEEWKRSGGRNEDRKRILGRENKLVRNRVKENSKREQLC